jgi:hypothetical protein
MDKPEKIKSRSPAHKARRLAGYEDDADWRRFLVRFLYHRMYALKAVGLYILYAIERTGLNSSSQIYLPS